MAMRNTNVRAALEPLLDRLVALYEQSAPSADKITPDDKQALADEALLVWGEIYDVVMSWVGHEHIGQHLIARNRRRIETANQLAPLSAREAANLAEMAGLWFAQMGDVMPKLAAEISEQFDTNRNKLVEMIAGGDAHLLADTLRQTFLPPALHQICIQLEALADSQASSAREPDHVRASVPDPILEEDAQARWRLEALRRVRVEVGKGKRKIYALADMAASVDQSIDTLQEWERQLVKSSDLENDLYCSELAGEFEAHFTSSHYTTIYGYERYGSYKGIYNLERAAAISANLHQFKLVDIAAAIRIVE